MPILSNSNKCSVDKHLEWLGLDVKDKVSDFRGIVQSVCFDLFGCIQADVRPKGLDKEGKIQTGWWLDINRLIIVNPKPVMDRPNYKYGDVSEGKQGAADKSTNGRYAANG